MGMMNEKALVTSILFVAGIVFLFLFGMDKEKILEQGDVTRKDISGAGSTTSPGEGRDLDMEGVMKDVDQIGEYYAAGKYEKAKALFRKVKRKVFEESDCAGMEYPTSVTLSLKYFDKLLKNRDGYFDGLSTFTGIAKEIYIGNTGAFQVKGKKEVMDFVYERDVLIIPDEDFGGRKVTVYFDGVERYGSYDAVKIVVHP